MVFGKRFSLVFFISFIYNVLSYNCLIKLNENLDEKLSSNLEKSNNSFYAIENKTILHTSPHPDDVTLGYLPYINWLLNNYKNKHFFLNMTSGSNAVRSSVLLEVLKKLEANLLKNIKNEHLESYILKNILNLPTVENDKLSILVKIQSLKNDLESGVDSFDIKTLKGAIREFEEELVWESFGISEKNIIHFRAQFYFDHLKLKDDINRFYELLIKINPDVVTVALDPKGVGPETHYKTFLVIQAAVKLFYEKTKKDISIIGYRNVWHQFMPSEANLFFPVTENDFKILTDTFLNCYKTQVDAMFPNSTYEGNFAQIATSIMKDNFKKLDNKITFDADAKGFCLLKKMEIQEFLDLHL